MNNIESDYNRYRYVGWNGYDTDESNLFTNETIRMISEKVTELLMGVDPKNRMIKVDDKVIVDVLSQIKTSHNSRVGDMFSRHIVHQTKRDDVKIIDETIGVIVNAVKNDIGMQEYNNSLSIWNTVLGDFNTHGLQRHSTIKVRKKKPTTMQFNMNY